MRIKETCGRAGGFDILAVSHENKIMKRVVLSSLMILLGLTLYAMQKPPESSVISVRVPVKVWEGSRFVDDLTLKDFELYEDGNRQDLEALYLFKNSKIHRREEKNSFSPSPQRHFILFFEISEYSAPVKEAVGAFVHNILSKGDNLTIVTPYRSYRMKSDASQVLTPQELLSQISRALEKDVLCASISYQNIVRDIETVARVLYAYQSGNAAEVIRDPATKSIIKLDQDGLITRYMSLMKVLEEMRRIDEEKLVRLSQSLKGKEGQKDIFFFYQRERIPVLDPKLYHTFLELYPNRRDTLYNLSYLNEFIDRDLAFDTERLKRAFFDSSTAIHFLFFSRPPKGIPGLEMVEGSGKMWEALNELARSTGGWVGGSDPALLFQREAGILDNYYLLYYTPKDYRADGKLREITVKVRQRRLLILYKTGYFAH